MNKIITILSYRFYVGEFLILFLTFFLMEGIFSWIFIRNSLIIEGHQKLLGILIYGFMLYKFGDLKKSERIIITVFSLLMLRLVLESLVKYNSFFKQLTMFTVMFPIVYIVFIKYIMRKMDVDLLEFLAKFYLITYLVFMALFGRGFSFSLEMVEMGDYGPFSGDVRIIHASHIFMMIIPLLWYLNQLLDTKKRKYILPLVICFGLIIVHQHRSVWSSTCVALFFYFISSIRNKIQNLSRIANLTIAAFIAVLVVCFFIANLMPGFIGFLSERFSEIFNPAKEGSTGNFRIEQREVYFQYFLDRPIFGWTFEGFEMPNPLVDWWPENSGQHFHEGYMEMLFYHGIVGLVFKYGFLVYLLFKAFSKNLSRESVILIAFCCSGLLFSFNYVLPLIFWGVVGMCMFYIEKDNDKLLDGNLNVYEKSAEEFAYLNNSKTIGQV